MKKRKIIFQYNAPFTLTFALISLIALILGWLTDGATTTKFFCVYRSSLTDPLTYLRFFTHTLGHASLSHYTGNILLLLVLGPGLEERYGSRSIFFATLITALVSGLVQWIFFPSVALLGASGVVFMMIIMASLGGARGDGIPLTLIFVFLFYVGEEVYDGIFVSDNISQLTHIVGGICGAVLGMSLRRRS
ncbi:MAG: rhomboid family intramembrane serine protease [Oscillospiraceae bacterium]|nr:rhomboid family intramembrane serine protease [Oscillospiraceae bacterium]MCD8016577.1 rhomboid family intramembrane serine protease [Oscillospiraceae bacterium]MCD8066473.1 rhomboid family intramembrane serine protease [Oscillospiraceae bacterium]MCD8100547.1 rhomboid family intramembrane serine protease [Oscillospiraceae bacterium]MCD8191850.1 rhomboid family intramembrane serine protease [Oscillospiraceae bacterium]